MATRITPVSDLAANANEVIDHAVSILGRSPLRIKVFSAIYHGKKKIKTVDEIAEITGLSRKQVLTEGKKLESNEIVEPTKVNGRTAYQKRDFYHHHKKEILTLIASPQKRSQFPTKRRVPAPNQKSINIRIEASRAQARHVAIDDIDNFAQVRNVVGEDRLPESISETDFKKRVQAVVGEPGDFRDWGGEKNDLFTTRVRVQNKRIRAAFAFKGPGTRGKLTPAKMGKNGDQIQRLFEADADVYFVQYWREIDQTVLQQMELIAMAKSVLNGGKEILFGIIDGKDSCRLWQAYPESTVHGTFMPSLPCR